MNTRNRQIIVRVSWGVQLALYVVIAAAVSMGNTGSL